MVVLANHLSEGYVCLQLSGCCRDGVLGWSESVSAHVGHPGSERQLCPQARFWVVCWVALTWQEGKGMLGYLWKLCPHTTAPAARCGWADSEQHHCEPAQQSPEQAAHGAWGPQWEAPAGALHTDHQGDVRSHSR